MNTLPTYFKIIGIAITLITIILNPIVIMLFYFTIDKSFCLEINHTLYDAFINIGPVLGLFLYALSKESIEDERLSTARLTAFRFAFFISIIATLLLGMFNEMVFGTLKAMNLSSINISAEVVIFFLLLIYIFCFEYKKRRV